MKYKMVYMLIFITMIFSNISQSEIRRNLHIYQNDDDICIYLMDKYKKTKKEKYIINEALNRASKKYKDIPKAMVCLIMSVETNFNHYDKKNRTIKSSAGAIGIGQLMPKTAKWLRVNPYYLDDNVEGIFKYLNIYAKKYPNIDQLAIIYNSGEGSYLTKGYLKNRETLNYIKRILNNLQYVIDTRKGVKNERRK